MHSSLSDSVPGPPLILVIDDEAVIVEALRRVLGADGYEVVTAADAETGMEALEAYDPGVVVIDLKLPGMSGLEFLSRVRTERPELVVVLMSGYSSTEHVILSLGAGAFGFLAKPFTFEEARNVVVRAVRYRQLPRSLQSPACVATYGFGLLGVQGWCRVSPEGEGFVGITDVYVRTVGAPTAIHAPPVGYPLLQGDVLVRIDDVDGAQYVAWSALGGRILELNQNVLDDPSLLARDAMGDGWIARVQTVTPFEDLERLKDVTPD